MAPVDKLSRGLDLEYHLEIKDFGNQKLRIKINKLKKIRPEINEIENRKLEKINKTKS